MSIKIKNNLDIILYFGIDDEEKLPIMDKEFLDLSKESKEYHLRLSEIYEDIQDKIYKFKPPCVITVDEGFIVSIEKDGKKTTLTEELPKKKPEEKKVGENVKEKVEEDNDEFPELITKKELNFMIEKLNANNSYLFINDDYTKHYKFIEQNKETLEFSLEDISLKEDNKILIDPFKTKFSPFVNLKSKIIFHDDQIIEKNFLIDINNSFEKIINKIENEIKPFVSNKDFRIIYKGKDIYFKDINHKVFRKLTKNQITKKKENENDNNNNNDNSEIEDFNNEAFLLKGEKKEEENTNQIIEKIIETNHNNEAEKKEEEKKEQLSLYERLKECKNLCEYGFNFKEESFTIIVPENSLKFCNFHNYQHYYYEARNKTMINLFAFDKDIYIKNLNVAGSTSKITYMKLTIHESLFEKTKYLNKENNFEKTDKLMDSPFWNNSPKLYESDKLVLECTYRKDDREITNINDYYTFLRTNKIRIKKNKVYALLVEFGPNSEYNYLYYNQKDSNTYDVNGDFKITYKSSYENMCFLNGFEYKLE